MRRSSRDCSWTCTERCLAGVVVPFPLCLYTQRCISYILPRTGRINPLEGFQGGLWQVWIGHCLFFVFLFVLLFLIWFPFSPLWVRGAQQRDSIVTGSPVQSAGSMRIFLINYTL